MRKILLAAVAACAGSISAADMILFDATASTVNFGEKTYAMKDGFVLPPHGRRFEIPLQCRNVGNARD